MNLNGILGNADLVEMLRQLPLVVVESVTTQQIISSIVNQETNVHFGGHIQVFKNTTIVVLLHTCHPL